MKSLWSWWWFCLVLLVWCAAPFKRSMVYYSRMQYVVGGNEVLSFLTHTYDILSPKGGRREGEYDERRMGFYRDQAKLVSTRPQGRGMLSFVVPTYYSMECAGANEEALQPLPVLLIKYGPYGLFWPLDRVRTRCCDFLLHLLLPSEYDIEEKVGETPTPSSPLGRRQKRTPIKRGWWKQAYTI